MKKILPFLQPSWLTHGNRCVQAERPSGQRDSFVSANQANQKYTGKLSLAFRFGGERRIAEP